MNYYGPHEKLEWVQNCGIKFLTKREDLFLGRAKRTGIRKYCLQSNWVSGEEWKQYFRSRTLKENEKVV
ncbi:hypothetical protein CEXT_68571 [Caerostris extrusa]|uniref:Uncharacterized protein n=1 Tax=Caerostris extrusa TaxID=172846 RepID=A0AAV4TMY8_CAEEX|nr:hypothetical protein CEXT_68571 [Caerostris extrusa]